MKKIIAFVLMLFVAGTSTAFAYGRHGHGGYHERSSHYGHSSGHYRHSRSRHNDGLGIALGVMGGLLLGSALVNAAPPPPAVVYEPPRYRQPRICVEDQVISGEWQYSRYDGRRVWVEYAYPITRRVQVPCY